MYKFLFTIFGTYTLSFGQVYAVTLDGSDMLDVDVQHTFSAISKHFRAHNEDDEILKTGILAEHKNKKDRVNKSFKLNEENIINFSSEEALNIIKNKVDEEFYKKIKGSLFNYFDIRATLIQRFVVAKSIWDLEQNLLERMKVVPRYANEADSDDNFDLIRNWNEIDRILFGAKAEITEAQFGKKTEKFSKRIDSNGKKWQIGDPRSSLLSLGVNEVDSLQRERAFYGNEDYSIAGSLDSVKRHLGAKWESTGLDNFSLLQEVEGKLFFQQSTMTPNLDMTHRVNIAQIPGRKELDPEVYEVQRENKIQVFFTALEDELLDRSRCEPLYANDERRSTVDFEGKTIDECMLLRNIELDHKIAGIKKTGNINPDEIYGFRITKTLQMLDNHFWSFLGDIKKMRKLLEDLSNKTVINRW